MESTERTKFTYISLFLLQLLVCGCFGIFWYLSPYQEHFDLRLTEYSQSQCESYIGVDLTKRKLGVILTADPGTFSGVSEAYHIIDNLQNKRLKKKEDTVCGEHYYGHLMGEPVLVVTTGIGPSAAALCTKEILDACGYNIRDIIYFGTAGWSPQLGGVLNPPHCDKANANGQITRIGDVCVSPFSVSWVCKKASWDMQAEGYPNECSLPRQNVGPDAEDLFGLCQFYADNAMGNLYLADEVTSASSRGVKNFPERSAAVAALEGQYWSSMSVGTGESFDVGDPASPPTIRGWQECMEVDGQFFYSGAPWEAVSRGYVADTLSRFKVKLLGGGNVSANSVIAVSAMEGVGVSEALERYHSLQGSPRPIPLTHVRAAANWVHTPLEKVGPGDWRAMPGVPEDLPTGYQYAIASGSSVVLNTYQQRCLWGAAAGDKLARQRCEFKINY